MNKECMEETFEKALENIREKFAIVAPNEDIVMSLIANHFSVKEIAYTRPRVTSIKIVDKNSEELCQNILERNNYDKKLYDYVKEHWESWKSDHIELILDNVVNDKNYMVIGPSFYKKAN